MSIPKSFASDPDQLKRAIEDIKKLFRSKFCHPIMVMLDFYFDYFFRFNDPLTVVLHLHIWPPPQFPTTIECEGRIRVYQRIWGHSLYSP